MEINEIEILSVGVDVGSATSHLAFSNLFLKRDERSDSRRFQIHERNVIYEGKIINTPFLDNKTIDIDTLTDFLKEEYSRAGIDPEDIQTGAVVVTGETAKKDNAKLIVEALSNDAGKFVAATAGPNFESLIAAKGSGATTRSKDYNRTILSCDIGGGTSNIAISKNGVILSTSCIAVGSISLGVNPEGKIWRIDEPASKVMEHIGLNYKIGDHIPREDVERIAETRSGPGFQPHDPVLRVPAGLTDFLCFSLRGFGSQQAAVAQASIQMKEAVVGILRNQLVFRQEAGR